MGEEKESTNTKYTKSCVMILMFISFVSRYTYHLGHNILRPFDVLPNFLLTWSEAKHNCL